MNETRTTSSAFEAELDAEDRQLLAYLTSIGITDLQVIDGTLCLSKNAVLQLCRITNTKKAAEFEKWIRRNYP